VVIAVTVSVVPEMWPTKTAEDWAYFPSGHGAGVALVEPEGQE
jgi:hypothetical protein